MSVRGIVPMVPTPRYVQDMHDFHDVLNELGHLAGHEDSRDYQLFSNLITKLRSSQVLLEERAMRGFDVRVGTKNLACSSCHRTDMETYYLRRSAGKYVVLCFDGGQGCWEQSSRTCCSYVDPLGVQCEELVEFNVVYGETMSQRGVCGVHVGAVLTGDVPSYKIYPVDAD